MDKFKLNDIIICINGHKHSIISIKDWPSFTSYMLNDEAFSCEVLAGYFYSDEKHLKMYPKLYSKLTYLFYY